MTLQDVLLILTLVSYVSVGTSISHKIEKETEDIEEYSWSSLLVNQIFVTLFWLPVIIFSALQSIFKD